MSEQLNPLELENAQLKAQAAQNSVGIQGLLTQLDVHKQMVSEQVNGAIFLRTQIAMLQKENKELNAKLEALNKQLEEANAKLIEANAKLDEVNAKLNPPLLPGD